MLPHVVKEADLAKAGERAKAAGEQVDRRSRQGACRKPRRSPKATYGIPVITHCCLEPHGQVIEWKGDQIEYWPSTQAVSAIAGDLAKRSKSRRPTFTSQMDYMGGGFGSKFPADRWGSEARAPVQGKRRHAR